MTFKEQVLNILLAQGPALLILMYSYLSGKAIRAEANEKILKLTDDIKGAHAKIDAQYAGKSDATVIQDIIGAKSTPSGSPTS